MNSFIPCAEKCIHQKEGHCHLEDLTHIGTNAHKGCIYFSAIL